MLERLLPLIRYRVHYLSIGNEVDVCFLNGREDEIAVYKTLVDHSRDYIHERAPEIKVGITITAGCRLQAAGGWTGAWRRITAADRTQRCADFDLLSSGRQFSDACTRYDWHAFPALVALVALADGKPLVFQEQGYPASALNGSSEAAQAEFVQEVFAAWQGSEQQIPFVNFFLLHDFSIFDLLKANVYYGIANPNFFAYLDSLGFRYRNSTPKAAWDVLLEEAESAGFR